MSTLTGTDVTAAPAQRAASSPTLKAFRLLTVNARGSAAMPWAILGMTFVVNLLIFAVAQSGIPADHRNTGALSSLYIVALVANLQVWTQVFPFAMGLSMTRGAFFRGTVLLLLLEAVFAGVVLLALKGLEALTGGWGLSLKFFAIPYVAQDNPFTQFLVYTVPYIALCALGMVFGVVFKRWGQSGMYALLMGSVVVLGGAAVVVTWRGWWGAVGRFFTETDPLLLMVGYPALLAAVCGAVAFLTVRRATP